MESRKCSYEHFKINKISVVFRKRLYNFQSFIQTSFGYSSLQKENVYMCGHLTDASTSSDPCKHLHLQQNLQRAQTCTVARPSWSEGHGFLATVFLFLFIFCFMHCNLRGGFGPMRFSLFPCLFQCIFCIWVPNMVSLPGPVIYFHHSDVQGGCWRYFTHI